MEVTKETTREEYSSNVDLVDMNVKASKMKIRRKSEYSQVEVRETWGNKCDFLMACIGFSVGLGNVWRFPYLCYKNGGGAFLIPYFLAVLVAGVPLFYLELAIGQYMSNGGLQAWNIVPLFQGIGLAACIVVFYLDCYYNIIMCWAFFYFFESFRSELPWVHCGNDWNTKNCSEDFLKNITMSDKSSSVLLDPITEYWENKVLGISDGIHDLGSIKWDLTLCLILAWVIVYLSICKGIKSSGKVWVDAGTQIFFSCSIGLGTLTALGSYNKFVYNSYRDAIIFNFVNSGTSILAGFIVFTSLGFMAKQQQRTVADVAESGPGLVFIAYPKAVAEMPVAPLWSAFFFLMIILLGLDSQFVGVEGVITTVVDQYPNFLKRGFGREVFIAGVCLVMFSIGLSMVCQGGMYVFQLFDYYSGSRIVMLIGLLELVAISYVYGIRRFQDNVLKMIGGDSTWLSKTIPYLVVCWAFLSPLFCAIIFTLSALNYTSLTYKRPNGRIYQYPTWSIVLGWLMAVSSAIWIPLVAFYKFVKHGATYEVFKLLLVPHHLLDHQKRPQDYNERSLNDYLEEKMLRRKQDNTADFTYNNFTYDPVNCQMFSKL